MILSPRSSFKPSTWVQPFILSFLFLNFLLSSGFFSLANAQSDISISNEKTLAQTKLKAMEQLSGATLNVTISSDTGFASFLATKPGREIPIPSPAFGPPEERALSFMTEFGETFGLHKASDFRALPARGLDEVGMEHVRLQQLYKGLPVTGGQLTVHMKGSLVTAVHAKTLGTIPVLETTPTIDAARALNAAQDLMEQQLGMSTADFSEPRLEIFNRGHLEGTVRPTQLAWFIEARGPRVREFIWIHAHSGGVLLHFNQISHGRNRQVYDANSSSALPGTLCRQEGNGPSGDADCDEAYDYSGDTYDYFFNEHGQDS